MARTILLADDSVNIQKVVELSFLDGDCDVLIVDNGDDALVRAEQESPDLVIADIHMPGASGYEVARRVKANHPGVPVLLLVGTFESFDADEYEASGADEYLQKPFDSQELVSLSEQLMARGGADETIGTLDTEGELGDGEEISAEVVGEAATVDAESGAAAPSQSAASEAGGGELSEADVDMIARRVIEHLTPAVLREVAWEMLPDLAEVVIKDRIKELEGQVE